MLITFYAIVGGDERYIGSTKNTISDRWSHHKAVFRLGLDHHCNSYKLFEKYGVENCHIEEIETRECATKEERDTREGELIRASPNCVNKDTPGNTYEEWYAEHLEEHLARCKEWREAHREEYLAQLKAYREDPVNREKRRAYNEAHREEINARQRERRRAAQTN